jgi:hypothetical protein
MLGQIGLGLQGRPKSNPTSLKVKGSLRSSPSSESAAAAAAAATTTLPPVCFLSAEAGSRGGSHAEAILPLNRRPRPPQQPLSGIVLPWRRDPYLPFLCGYAIQTSLNGFFSVSVTVRCQIERQLYV